MKRLLILGAGTGGTIVANKMAHRLDPPGVDAGGADAEVHESSDAVVDV